MEQVNSFMKGVTSDLDNFFVPTDQMVFPTHNIRFFNRDGKGFVATPIKGQDILFSITYGFTPVAINEIKGVIFVVSVKDDITELGYWKKEDNYKPLSNYENDVFQSKSFGYTIKSNIKLLLDQVYDGSVNLYLCDGENYDYVINCGFNIETGEINDIRYVEDNFNNILFHIPSTILPVKASFKELLSNGHLRPGTYELFFRYSTVNFDKTEFMSSIYPIVVGYGDDIRTTRGVINADENNVSQYINKSIKIGIEIADLNYTYINIGVVRYYSGPDGSPAFETYELATRYDINSKEIVITGYEPKSIMILDEFYAKYVKEKISKDHIFLNGYIWKANLKRKAYDKDKLADFVKLIKIDPFSENAINIDRKYWEIELGQTDKIFYQDPYKIFYKLSYFEGEIYPFGALFLMNDGTYSEVFPVNNYDFMFTGRIIPGDPKGLIRFPDNHEKTKIHGLQYDLRDAVAAYIDDPFFKQNVKAVQIVRGNRIENLLYDGIIAPTALGFEYGEIEDDHYVYHKSYFGAETRAGAYSVPLPYRGYNLDVIDADENYIDGGSYVPNNESNQCAVPYIVKSQPDESTGDKEPKYQYRTGTRIYDPRKYAFLSGDYMTSLMSKVPNGKDLIIEINTKRYRVDYSTDKLSLPVPPNEIQMNHSDENIYDNYPSEYSADPIHYNNKKDWITKTVTVHNIEKGMVKGSGGFSSYFSDPTNTNGSADWEDIIPSGGNRFGLRSYMTPKYLGIVFSEDIGDYIAEPVDPNTGWFNRSLKGGEYLDARIYQNENTIEFMDTIISSFNVSANRYVGVSDITLLYNLSISYKPRPKIYKGDNFKAKMFFRVTRFFDFDDNAHPEHYDKYGYNKYQHGFMFGFVFNNENNILFRAFVNGKSDEHGSYPQYTFYPANRNFLSKSESWIFDSDAQSDLVESFAMNTGYGHSLGLMKHLGYDENLPDIDYHFPTKIAFSSKRKQGSYIDNYRDIPISNYQIFQTNLGDIIRLAEGFSMLISVRERGTVRHYLGRKKLAAEGSEVVTGSPLIYLSDEEMILGYYGIQYFHALTSSKRMLYGVDVYSGVIWGVVFSSTQMGVKVADQAELSRKFFVDGKVKKLTAMINNIEDAVITGNGVSVIYNDKFKELTFNFFINEGRTFVSNIVFNEDLQTFGGSSSNHSVLAVNSSGSMISTGIFNDSRVFKNDIVNFPRFFGVRYGSELSFIVNGTAGKEQNAQLYIKVFESLDIRSPHKVFDSIIFQTETQTAVYNFSEDSDKFWEDAEYTEDRWFVPIVNSLKSEDWNEQDSEIKGQWMKVTLVFKQNSDFYIRSVMTKFALSFS